MLLRGGLGNQLFQYFSARELAIDTPARLVLDARLLPAGVRHSQGKSSEFSEEISSFLHDGIVINSHESESLPKGAQRWLQVRIAQYVRAVARSRVCSLGRFRHLSGDATLLDKPTFAFGQEVILNHLFLNPTIFRYSKDQSVRALDSIANPTPWFVAKKAEICERSPLAIHHRLGDHVRLGRPASLDYIKRALLYLKTKCNSDGILVFTDDVSMSKEILRELQCDLEYVEPPPESRPIESLVLLSNCQGLVMSRSSFSWWAATLGAYSGSTAVINREWLCSSSTPDFFREIPNSWVKL